MAAVTENCVSEGDAMTPQRLWKYIQFAGLFVFCLIVLVQYLLDGFYAYDLFLRVKPILDRAAVMVPLGVAVCVLIALRGAKGRAVFAERARQKGEPPVT
jgi:hypothetical protein